MSCTLYMDLSLPLSLSHSLQLPRCLDQRLMTHHVTCGRQESSHTSCKSTFRQCIYDTAFSGNHSQYMCSKYYAAPPLQQCMMGGVACGFIKAFVSLSNKSILKACKANVPKVCRENTDIDVCSCFCLSNCCHCFVVPYLVYVAVKLDSRNHKITMYMLQSQELVELGRCHKVDDEL